VSQRELAAAAHVPQSTIAHIESAARQPSLPLLAQILDAVELEPRVILEAHDAHDDVLDADDAPLLMLSATRDARQWTSSWRRRSVRTSRSKRTPLNTGELPEPQRRSLFRQHDVLANGWLMALKRSSSARH
jgi:transcriptional regulator with XRE-family HTH domain